MANYTVIAAGITNTNNVDILYAVQSATPRNRLKLWDLLLGSAATPANESCNYELIDVTDEATTPTGSVVTPAPMDPDSAASDFNARTASNPTGTVILMHFPVNQQATFRWIAQPGKEFMQSATEDQGWSLRADTPTTAFAVDATFFIEE
jgi:hypothetical protein